MQCLGRHGPLQRKSQLLPKSHIRRQLPLPSPASAFLGVMRTSMQCTSSVFQIQGTPSTPVKSSSSSSSILFHGPALAELQALLLPPFRATK